MGDVANCCCCCCLAEEPAVFSCCQSLNAVRTGLGVLRHKLLGMSNVLLHTYFNKGSEVHQLVHGVVIVYV